MGMRAGRITKFSTYQNLLLGKIWLNFNIRCILKSSKFLVPVYTSTELLPKLIGSMLLWLGCSWTWWSLRSFPTWVILWFYDSMILWIQKTYFKETMSTTTFPLTCSLCAIVADFILFPLFLHLLKNISEIIILIIKCKSAAASAHIFVADKFN